MKVLLTVAGVGCGIVAGLLFVFSAGIMSGLGRLPGEHGAAAMRAINRGVLNPLFLGVFAGTGVALVVAAVLTGGFVVVAAGLYVVGVLGVTGVVNVPLNEALDADRVTWERYRTRWTRWNHLRTASAVAALGLLLA